MSPVPAFEHKHQIFLDEEKDAKRREQNRESTRLWRLRNAELNRERQRGYCKTWRAKHPEKFKQAIRNWRYANPDKVKAIDERKKLNNPEKVAARNAVNAAIRDGRLVRMPCEVCGATPTEGHHDDYSKPLSVRWLCKQHHEEIKENDQASQQ